MQGQTDRRFVVLGGVAAAALAVVVAITAIREGGTAIAILRGAARTPSGFIGIVEFGKWRLICSAGATIVRDVAADDAAKRPQRSNSCRVNQEIAGADGAVVLAANLSLVGARQTPALMLRLPPTAHRGDPVLLRFDDGSARAAVRDCTDKECVAASVLTPDAWQKLAHAKMLRVTLPAANGQTALLELPADGLAGAMAALSRAQTAAR